MSKSCLVTGKKTTSGNNVSHSNVKTRRKLFPNLQSKRLVDPSSGKTIRVTVSTRGLRTLRKWDREGTAYDLAALKKASLAS